MNEMETVANEEHNYCTAIDWDPTGRFVATSVSHWRHQIDTGYNIYDFTGKLRYKVIKDKFFQILWRPRPATLLTEERLAELRKNMAPYNKKYTREQSKLAGSIDRQAQKERNAQKKKFNDLATEREKEYAEWKLHLKELYGRDVDAEESEVEEIEETTEELLDVEEEIID